MKKYRKYAQYAVLTVLLGMLIVSFGLWGVGDMVRTGGGDEVAHVGGTHIPVYGWIGGTSVSATEVRDLFNRQLELIQRQTGQRPDPEQALRYGIHFRALEDVVQRAVIDNAIREYGIVVGDDQVRAAIALKPDFRGSNGAFDPILYKNRLQQARILETDYVADIRREVASSQLLGVIQTPGISPTTIRDDIFKMENERRIAETVYVPDTVIATVPKPTAEQLDAYFEASKLRFRIPEYRAFSYVLMSVDDVMNQVTVTPEQVKQEYDARQGEFGSPEKRDVDQAMADTEDKAKKIIAAAQAGKSLEEATKEVTGNADGVIKLGTVLKKDLPAGALADGVFAAPNGLDPNPIKSPLGWHVVRINKIDTGKVTPFDEVKNKLADDIKAQLAPDLLIKMVNDFERVFGKTQSMKAAAEELQLKVRSYDSVDSSGKDASGKQVVIGPAAAEMVQAAFATRESTESDLLETPKGEYFVVRTDRVTPARVPALSEVDGKVTEAWQSDERRKLADAKVKEALGKAIAGGDLAAIAKELGVQVETSKPVSRYDTDPASHLAQPATQELFKLAVGKSQSVRVADGSVIVRTKTIQPADVDKAMIDRFGAQLDAMLANDLVAQFLRALGQKFGLTVNQAVFSQTFAPQQAPQ